MLIRHTLRTLADAYAYCQDHNFEQYMVDGLVAGERFIARARNWTPVAWWLYGVWCWLFIARDIIVCEAWGHDMVGEGYGTPDSGCDAGYCRRCGWSYHVTMY